MEEVLEIFTTWEYFKDKIKTSHVSCSHVFVRNEHWRFHTGMWPKACISLSSPGMLAVLPNLLSYWIKICAFEIFSWYVWIPFYLYFTQLENTTREIAVLSTTGPIKGRDQHYSTTTIRALLTSSLSLQTHSNLEWAGTVFFSLHILKTDLVFILAQGLTWHLWGWTTSMCTSARLS